MQLVLDTNGTTLKVRNQSFWIINKTQRRTISPKKVSSIAILQNCLLSSAAVRLAVEHRIPITFFHPTGKPQAHLWSPYFGSIASIRRQQVLFFEKPQATHWIIGLFKIKSVQQIQNLEWLLHRNPTLASQLPQILTLLHKIPDAMQPLAAQPPQSVQNSLMGIEGAAARAYWQILSAALPAPWQFATRNRRPALDSFNAALNYLYGMLYNIVENALFSAGLDPHLGILHSDEYNRPTLSFDIIEPFRPWVDRLLLELIIHQQLTPDGFEHRDGGIFVARLGKEILIPAFNECMIASIFFQQRNASRKNHIQHFATAFAQQLLAQHREMPDAKMPDLEMPDARF